MQWSCPRAILHDDPYPVRAMLVWGASIITGYPNPGLWRRAFSALDFLLVVDRFPTEDSRYADIILPAATSFEEDSYLISGRRVELRRKVIEPQGESRSDWDIVAAIAGRLGYGHLFPRSSREMLRWAFEGTEIDLEELEKTGEVSLPVSPMRYRKWESGLLRRDGKPGFDTPSGKLEIASSILKENGYDPLPGLCTAPGRAFGGPRAFPGVSPRVQFRLAQQDFLQLPAPQHRAPRRAETQSPGVDESARCAPSRHCERRCRGRGDPERPCPIRGFCHGGYRSGSRGGGRIRRRPAGTPVLEGSQCERADGQRESGPALRFPGLQSAALRRAQIQSRARAPFPLPGPSCPGGACPGGCP